MPPGAQNCSQPKSGAQYWDWGHQGLDFLIYVSPGGGTCQVLNAFWLIGNYFGHPFLSQN